MIDRQTDEKDGQVNRYRGTERGRGRSGGDFFVTDREKSRGERREERRRAN